MKIKFSIDYRTVWGQRPFVAGSLDALGSWTKNAAQAMNPVGGGTWELEIDIPKAKAKAFEYKYFILDERYDSEDWEYGDNRIVSLEDTKANFIHLIDNWRSQREGLNNLYTAPFKNAFFKRNSAPVENVVSDPDSAKVLQFQLRAPRVGSRLSVCVVGNIPALGSWDDKKALVLRAEDYPLWTGKISLPKDAREVSYKYGIYDAESKKILTWESGDNRSLVFPEEKKGMLVVRSDEYFRYPVGNWKGAGVAIPVFSIRTEQSSGVGQFSDIKQLVDWAKLTGMKIVQVLPVNDTVATHTWVDSYPYAAVSVYALHPIYGDLKAIGPLKNEANQNFMEKESAKLNAYDHVAYEEVMALKSKYYKWAFDEQKANFLKDKDFLAFFKNNQHWLVPYAAFSYLRDSKGTVDFTQWGQYSQIDATLLADLTDPKAKHYDDIAIHYFIQYHLDKQLKEATAYARENQVVLKGDIPIGIYRNSVDAWLYPHLFNMESQAGAPPDDFSRSGQNWGFPTYNWTEMAKDDYQWWKARLQKMADYFDVFRIDHILGFFRIWEIPYEGVEGTMGHFNPSLPFGIEEMYSRGIPFNYERMCKPYIRTHILDIIFGKDASGVADYYLEEVYPGVYKFKEAFDTQRKVKNYFASLMIEDAANAASHLRIRDGLYQLHGEVLFFEAPFSNGAAFNPRVGMHSTYSFRELAAGVRQAIDTAYIDYFYKRHNDFWRGKAMEKLPALKNATDMLICGEDLGMVPDCVPGVMEELSLLSLAIQRMPNDSSMEFWHPSDTPYLSVCSTSSHDTSTLRGWWEEDREKTQRFFNNILGNWGEAPLYCEPWIATQVINQHLYSPSMWAIFPLQDILAMDSELRRIFPEEERINVPANPQHYWKYRMHLPLERLVEEAGFNSFLKQLIDQSGRNADY